MGLLDDVMKSAAGAAPAKETSQVSLAVAALSMLSAQSGGLSGLVQQFASRGLGSIISSWVSTGQNLPITPQQLQNGLGAEQVKAMATQAGISPEAANIGLAQILPKLIDGLTPQGQVPQGDLMAQGMALLKGKLLS